MKAGMYDATIESYGISTTKAGKPFVAVDFKTDEGNIRWNGYLNEGMSTEITCKTLADLGYKGKNLEPLADGEGLDTTRVYYLTVKEEEYNGKMYAKVAWINLEKSASTFVAPKDLKGLLAGRDLSADLLMAQQETKRDSVPKTEAPTKFDDTDIPF